MSYFVRSSKVEVVEIMHCIYKNLYTNHIHIEIVPEQNIKYLMRACFHEVQFIFEPIREKNKKRMHENIFIQ